MARPKKEEALDTSTKQDETIDTVDLEKPSVDYPVEKENVSPANVDNFNADNRRISRLLQADRESRQISVMQAQNRKLKQEVARLRQEVSNSQA